MRSPYAKLLCYVNIMCEDQAIQWKIKGKEFNFRSAGYYYSGGSLKLVGWQGGADPFQPLAEIGTNHSKQFYEKYRSLNNVPLNMTEPYRGKLCLQKAALKALSRRGWELTDPAGAFTSENWTVVKKSCL
jgi:hypothetical protein